MKFRVSAFLAIFCAAPLTSFGKDEQIVDFDPEKFRAIIHEKSIGSSESYKEKFSNLSAAADCTTDLVLQYFQEICGIGAKVTVNRFQQCEKSFKEKYKSHDILHSAIAECYSRRNGEADAVVKEEERKADAVKKKADEDWERERPAREVEEARLAKEQAAREAKEKAEAEKTSKREQEREKKCVKYVRAGMLVVERKLNPYEWVVRFNTFAQTTAVLRTKEANVFSGPQALAYVCPSNDFGFSCWTKLTGARPMILDKGNGWQEKVSVPVLREVKQEEVKKAGCKD